MLDQKQEQETLFVTAQPVFVKCLYKDTFSSLVVLATGPQEGFVMVPDYDVYEDFHFGDFLNSLPLFTNKEEWEYFKGELVICNPTTMVGQTSEENTDGDLSTST